MHGKFDTGYQITVSLETAPMEALYVPQAVLRPDLQKAALHDRIYSSGILQMRSVHWWAKVARAGTSQEDVCSAPSLQLPQNSGLKRRPLWLYTSSIFWCEKNGPVDWIFRPAMPTSPAPLCMASVPAHLRLFKRLTRSKSDHCPTRLPPFQHKAELLWRSKLPDGRKCPLHSMKALQKYFLSLNLQSL